MRNIKILAACSLLLLSACTKDASTQPQDNNRIDQVLNDNFNLTVMNAVISRSNLTAALNSSGPFTVFAPSDEAFAKSGFTSALSVLSTSAGLITSIGAYHTVEGRYDLNKLPFLFNQEIVSKGGKLFVTRWIKNEDTIITINGSRLLSNSIRASNGEVQVIDRMLEPYLHETIADAMAAEATLTLFWQAVQRAGIVAQLKGPGPFTIYAPDNAAMTAMGYGTVADILNAPVATITALVKYQVVADRRFVNDYILTTAAGKSSTTQGMLDNNSITVNLTPDAQQPGAFSGITLKGIGNTTNVNLVKQDIISGNGVLHITDKVLRITQ